MKKPRGTATIATVISTRAMVTSVNLRRRLAPLRLSSSILCSFLSIETSPRNTARTSFCSTRPSCANETSRRAETNSAAAKKAIASQRASLEALTDRIARAALCQRPGY